MTVLIHFAASKAVESITKQGIIGNTMDNGVNRRVDELMMKALKISSVTVCGVLASYSSKYGCGPKWLDFAPNNFASSVDGNVVLFLCSGSSALNCIPQLSAQFVGLGGKTGAAASQCQWTSLGMVHTCGAARSCVGCPEKVARNKVSLKDGSGSDLRLFLLHQKLTWRSLECFHTHPLFEHIWGFH